MIRVNDKWDVAWQSGFTVNDVLVSCGFTLRTIVVTINGHLVPPDDYAARQVDDGDQVRVVHIIGGG